MTSPQNLIEKILAKAKCDECIVIVREKTQVNLRWATSTLTTNGSILERSITILAFISIAEGFSVGGVTRSQVDDEDIEDLLDEATKIAKASGLAEDYSPIAQDLNIGDWNSAHSPTSPEIFRKFAPELGELFQRSKSDGIELFGYAEHSITTTWLGSLGGLRLRHDSPIGRVEMTGKSHERTRSTWEGVETHDFNDVSMSKIDCEIRKRLNWQARKIDLPIGEYQTIFPSGAVADLFAYMLFVASARDAWDGQSVFSRNNGGTRIGEKLSDFPINLYSDPDSSLLPGSPFIANTSSNSIASVFDNGMKNTRVDWLKSGILQSLIQTRFSAKLTSQPFTPLGDNYFMNSSLGNGSLDELISNSKESLLVTTLWYIRLVDPNTLLLTGLTRDGVYLVKDGEVQGSTGNFRWNDSPIDALKRIKSVGTPERTLPREWSEDISQLHMPPMVISDFNMSSLSPGN